MSLQPGLYVCPPAVTWRISLTTDVTSEWLVFLHHIREVPNSHLVSDTDYSDCDFSWYSSVFPGKYGDIALKLGKEGFLPNPLLFSVHQSFLHSTLGMGYV
jgi:hypothetical protein